MVLAIKDLDIFPYDETNENADISADDLTLEAILADYNNTKDFPEEDELPAEPSQPQEKQQQQKKKKKKKPYRGMRITAILLSIILFGESLYCLFAFSNLSFCKNLREMFVDTALETNSHRWLADYFLPNYIVEQREQQKDLAGKMQEHYDSERPSPTQPPAEYTEIRQPGAVDTDEPTESTEPTVPDNTLPLEESEDFYELYWELNRSSFEAYLFQHPEVLANGWENIYINEAGLDDEGTSIYTSMGEQVLAIDVPNKLLLVRVEGSGYLGVLAVCKDPAQLRCEASAGIGSYGQKVGTIVKNSGGVLGMSASGFYDPEGMGNGGVLAGYAMCEGKEYGNHYTYYGYKRIELVESNKLYIIDSYKPVASDVTDACEFTPALIIDGEFALGGWSDWNANNPRACLGQGVNDEILMLMIEGRQVGRSIGTTVEECAKIMMRHKAYTAMNLDGGASAIMYYNGEYIVRCGNGTAEGRFLPNAWVYGNYE